MGKTNNFRMSNWIDGLKKFYDFLTAWQDNPIIGCNTYFLYKLGEEKNHFFFGRKISPKTFAIPIQCSTFAPRKFNFLNKNILQ